MVFTSEIFLFQFLPITLFLYYLLDKRFKNLWLLLASFFFYAWGEPVFVLLMVVSIISNYLFGLLIDWLAGGKPVMWGRMTLAIVCAFDIGLLCCFKYASFIVENLNRLGFSFPVPDNHLPIGISFFTFQIMSYIIDLYRHRVPVQRNILNLGLYISLFPQLIAGPIVRYSDVEQEISSRSVEWADICAGAKRFMFGFAKKILIADQVSAIANTAFSSEQLSMNMAWLGIVAYTIQIYFDFSGYSDMAIGLGRLFGFHFLENFDYPYISSSIREFWRRWHISLGNWFRDYVYIPLGGSRVSKLRLYQNLLVVFFLTGLWHGASWNFVVWGGWYGVFIIIERALGQHFQRIPSPLRRVYTLLVVAVGWVFFRADNLKYAWQYICAMFSFCFDDAVLLNVTSESLTFLLIGSLLSMPLYPRFTQKVNHGPAAVCTDVLAILCFLLAIMYMVGLGFSPFLYFRF